MDKIQLSKQDVVSFEDLKPFGLPRTNRFSEFQEKLEEVLKRYGGDNRELLDLGINCEILQLGSQKWQKGKLKISIEFVCESNESESNELNSSDLNSILNEFREN